MTSDGNSWSPTIVIPCRFGKTRVGFHCREEVASIDRCFGFCRRSALHVRIHAFCMDWRQEKRENNIERVRHAREIIQPHARLLFFDLGDEGT